jgi:hypothetical protein
VRFHDGIARLLREGHRLMLEVGPGASLSGLLRRLRGDDAPQALQTLRHPAREERDPQMLLQAIGRCWQAGARIDWATFGAAASHRRIPLPTYPFGGGCYWLPSASASARIVDADALIQAGIRDVEAPDAEPDTQRTAYEAPRDELEELLAELWWYASMKGWASKCPWKPCSPRRGSPNWPNASSNWTAAKRQTPTKQKRPMLELRGQALGCVYGQFRRAAVAPSSLRRWRQRMGEE